MNEVQKFTLTPFCDNKFLNRFLGEDGIAFPDEESNQLNEERLSALRSNFIPYNNIPMGATHVKSKLIMTVPRRSPGVPSTLNYISTKSTRRTSPSFRAFPDYKTNELHVRNNRISLHDFQIKFRISATIITGQ